MHYKEGKLKAVCGKRISLIVSLDDSYHKILEKAIEKWVAYYSNCYDEKEEYVLLFVNFREASIMPGNILDCRFLIFLSKFLYWNIGRI